MNTEARQFGRRTRLLAALCVLAQLAVVGAALWHGLHDAASNDDCAVCAAVLTQGEEPAPAPAVHGVAEFVALVDIVGEVAPRPESPVVLRARGPPWLS